MTQNWQRFFQTVLVMTLFASPRLALRVDPRVFPPHERSTDTNRSHERSEQQDPDKGGIFRAEHPDEYDEALTILAMSGVRCVVFFRPYYLFIFSHSFPFL